MDLVKHFLEYAAAFEKAFADDEWSRLESFFTEDAAYVVSGGPPMGGRWEGRAAALGQLKTVVDELDRRFDERKTEILGAPKVGEDTLEFEWKATYRMAGCPDLVFGGLERATYEGGAIRLLEDEMEEGTDTRIQEWMAKHFD